MRKAFLVFVCLILTLQLAGCGLFTSKSSFEAAAKEYYEAIKGKDFQRAADFNSPAVFKKLSKEEIVQLFSKTNTKLGDLQSFQLVDWNIHYELGIQGGVYCSLLYKVVYSKSEAEETVDLFRPIAGGQVKIIGYNVSSKDLLLG